MNDIYGSLNGNIRSIDESDPDCAYNLNEYYVKTAYNACSGGSYKSLRRHGYSLSLLVIQVMWFGFGNGSIKRF